MKKKKRVNKRERRSAPLFRHIVVFPSCFFFFFFPLSCEVSKPSRSRPTKRICSIRRAILETKFGEEPNIVLSKLHTFLYPRHHPKVAEDGTGKQMGHRGPNPAPTPANNSSPMRNRSEQIRHKEETGKKHVRTQTKLEPSLARQLERKNREQTAETLQTRESSRASRSVFCYSCLQKRATLTASGDEALRGKGCVCACSNHVVPGSCREVPEEPTSERIHLFLRSLTPSGSAFCS